jgi:hypothetical protein
MADILMQLRPTGDPLNRRITAQEVFDSPQFLSVATTLFQNDIVGLVSAPSGTPVMRKGEISFLNSRTSVGTVGFNWNQRNVGVKLSPDGGVLNLGLMGNGSSPGAGGVFPAGRGTSLNGTNGQLWYLTSNVLDCNYTRKMVCQARISHTATAVQTGIIRAGFGGAGANFALASINTPSIFLMCNTATMTNWHLEHRNSSTVQTDTGVAYAANTVFLLEWVYTPGVSIEAYIDGVHVLTAVTELPTGTTASGLLACQNTTDNSGGIAYDLNYTIDWTV